MVFCNVTSLTFGHHNFLYNHYLWSLGVLVQLFMMSSQLCSSSGNFTVFELWITCKHFLWMKFSAKCFKGTLMMVDFTYNKVTWHFSVHCNLHNRYNSAQLLVSFHNPFNSWATDTSTPCYHTHTWWASLSKRQQMSLIDCSVISTSVTFHCCTNIDSTQYCLHQRHPRNNARITWHLPITTLLLHRTKPGNNHARRTLISTYIKYRR